MTKKHFVEIAVAFRLSRPERAGMVGYDRIGTAYADGEESGKLAQWERCCESVADALGRLNPRFDRDRFLKACGVE